MSKRSMGQKKAMRERQEKAALSNIFNVFLMGLAAECFLFLVYKCYIGGTVSSLLIWDTILRVAIWVGLAAFVGCGAAAYLKRSDSKKRNLFAILSAVGAFLSLTGWLSTAFFETGVVTLCAVVPVLTVLGLIFFLYQRECFVTTTLLAASLFTVWLCSRGTGSALSTVVMVIAVAAIVVLAAAIFLARMAKSKGGKVFGLTLFSTDCDYRVVYIACALCALVVLAALVVPSISYYLVWVLVIGLFAELAYYTTKLM